jgi:HD-GYP domain-containing protein (c-di-GMP phosphodiesterase class II)
VVQEVAALPETTPWRTLALDAGYRSMIALPLPFGDGAAGVLAIYSGQPNAFNADTVEVLTELAGDVSFGVDALRERRQRSAFQLRFEESLEAAVRAVVTAAELRDPYTAGHQRRVAELALAIAAELGIPSDEAVGIGTAASIHDIGKLTVPAEILSRPGRLSSAEFELVKEHAQAGHDIVAGIDFPWPVADMILQHHERLDGSGYPSHLQGDAILLGARILAVADTVEAMQSHRPYRPGLGVDAALATIGTGRGILFDPDVVDACTRVCREGGFHFTA